jgi:hypothetical protein
MGGHFPRMGEMTNAYKFWSANLKMKHLLVDLYIYERIKLT